ncbi:MAG: diacylglycerol kinase family protein [Terracoccus sp.]
MSDLSPSTSPSTRRRLTVIYNPMKVEDLDGTKRIVGDVCSGAGWDEPTWVETTKEETGEKQAKQAVSDGADVVASLGGDGTVRAVASGLVGTDVALGLLPGGTGNLLARNLGLPVDELGTAVEAVVNGSDRRIDVGLVRASKQHIEKLGEPEEEEETPPPRAEGEEVFLVMTGMGLDGDVMADTNEKVKAVVGWIAYVFAALSKLFTRGFSVDVSANGSDGHAGSGDGSINRHARSVIIGNCGHLQGGVELMPEAKLDDGVLDAVIVAPKGALGWLSVVIDIATHHRAGHARLDRVRGRKFIVSTERPVEAEIDGDPIGEARSLAVRILADGLVVRVG